MNTRRSFMQSLLVAPFVFLFKPKPSYTPVFTTLEVTRDEAKELYCPVLADTVFNTSAVVVSTLEHNGWGFRDDEGSPTRYVARWMFTTQRKAEEFVRSLYPRIVRIWVDDRPYKALVRSGYRGAVRAQFDGGITRMEVEIAQKQADGSYKSVELDRPLFWTVADAWGWLENIRVDGHPVNRPGKSPSSLSEYLTQPFAKGTPKIYNQSDYEWQMYSYHDLTPNTAKRLVGNSFTYKAPTT